MRRTLLTAAIGLALAFPTPAHAQTTVYDVFSNYVDSLRAQIGIPGIAAAIVGQQSVLWQGAFGQQDLERNVATRTDTPFHLDDLTQTVTAVRLLQCVEEGKLSLDAPIGRFTDTAPDPGATIAQLLTHTTRSAGTIAFAYNPARLAPLAFALSACSGESSREMIATLLEQNLMMTSVPGPDAIDLVPPYEGVTLPEIDRYAAVLQRLATPYNVPVRGRALPSKYPATTLTPASGLISTVQDLAEFDLSLKDNFLLKPETLAAAWQPPLDAKGVPLPHGLGWFVQTYNGKQVVWQFGLGDGASSSLMLSLPAQGLTFILLANSDGLVKPFGLAAGDVTASPFARVFLATFAR